MNRYSLDSIICESWNLTYFDSFRVEHIPKEIWKFIRNKKNITTIYRIQTCDSITCKKFCMISWKKTENLLDYTNLSSPNEYKANDKIILKCFQ